MKLRCDGQSPCGSCIKRNLDCNNERTPRPGHAGLDEGRERHTQSHQVDRLKDTESSPSTVEMYEQPSARGSIKFLLNGGTDSFTEHFQLPPSTDRARGMVWHNQTGLQEVAGGTFPHNMQGSRPEYNSGLVQSDPAALQFFQETFLDFFHGPFRDGQKPAENQYTGQVAYQAAMPTGQGPEVPISPGQAIYEPERPFAIALIQSIRARAWAVPLNAEAQEEISNNLNFLLTTSRIRKFVALYFKYWQTHCAMIHIPSFDPETASLPLLASIVFMGAMYSTDQREVYVAKRVLDFAELFVFSSHVYSPDTEVAVIFSGAQPPNDQAEDWMTFQNCQAGFIITIVQYWAGTRASRSRGMENRFSEVIKVRNVFHLAKSKSNFQKLARRLGLVKSRHLPHEQSAEQLWIQKECRIRLVTAKLSQ